MCRGCLTPKQKCFQLLLKLSVSNVRVRIVTKMVVEHSTHYTRKCL